MFHRKKYKYIDMIILYFKTTPVASAINLLNFFIQPFLYSITILAPANFINTAIKIVNKEAETNEIIVPILILIAIAAYQYFFGIFMNLVNTKAQNNIRKKVEPVLLEKKAKLKFRYYENQEHMDIISRVTGKFIENITGFYSVITNFGGNIIQITTYAVILASQIWWAAIVMLLLSVPIFIIGYKSGKKIYEADKEMTKIDRKVDYFRSILTGRDTIEERYMFGFTDKLNKDHERDYEYQRLFRKKVSRRRWIDMKATSILVALYSVFIIGLLILPTVEGKITIGLFTSLAGGILNIGNAMSWGISWNLSEFKYKREYLSDLNKFLGFEEESDCTVLPAYPPLKLESIEFKNVSFRYPGTENLILKNMSFQINAGKHYAIVGANGAGKTTITKLITGLYTEFEGEILINGRDIKSYTQAELKSLASVVYQDFAKYPIDFYNNIAIGNTNGLDAKNIVEEAVSILNLTKVVDKLPQKYDTPLTKVKANGVDLSGGEWQRVVLARTIVNPAPLKILDEPTAALDPISESRVYQQFTQISNYFSKPDNTVIFISHRLGSTKLANEIIVISDGKVCEQGTFEYLMAKDGLYAQMFRLQAEWYQNENEDKDENEADDVQIVTRKEALEYVG